jgi:UDPglucose 6-dehydrogenase
LLIKPYVGTLIFKVTNISHTILNKIYMKLAFIGTGYVGLVSGVMMSHLGHHVICIDVDKTKINLLKEHKSPIFEPNLENYLLDCSNQGRIEFMHEYDNKLLEVDCVFITVGTPSMQDGSADLSYIYEAANAVAKYIRPECIVVIKSTVPPGTCKSVQDLLLKNGFRNSVVSNPEFLREGSAISDFLNPDRIVVGTSDQHSALTMEQVYLPLINQGIKLVLTDLITSELIKYASNSFLAAKIAFINEMADLCEIVGADVEILSQAVGLDKRIGASFLKAGPGFGGSCFPKDILALQKLTMTSKGQFLLLDALITANQTRADKMVQKIKAALSDNLKNKIIAILGLTYKAGTDDLRSSPSIPIIEGLRKEEAKIVAYDPKALVNVPKYFGSLECKNSEIEAISGADALVIITEWPEFKYLDLVTAKKVMRGNVIVDLRNILNQEQVISNGFEYHSIGRKKRASEK